MDREPFENIDREGIVKDEPALWLHSGNTLENGRLILTSRRLMFARNEADSTSPFRFYIDNRIVQLTIQIDLDTINAITHESYKTDNNILALTYLQYEMAKFSVLDYDDWERTIQGQQMTPNI